MPATTSHPYESPERPFRFVMLAITLVAGLLAFGLYKLVQLIPDYGLVAWVTGPSVTGFWAALYWLYDHHLWRRLWFDKTPDLSGIWEGTVVTDDPVIDPLLGSRHTATLVIHQTWSSISISFEGETSTSQSLSASITRSGSDRIRLVYTYYAQGRDPTDVDYFPAHYGTAVEERDPGSNTLLGYYFTAPRPMHSGKLSLTLASARGVPTPLAVPETPSTFGLIVDTDGGIDDAVALSLLARHSDEAIFSLELVTVTGGNVSIGQAVANVRYVLAQCGLPETLLRTGGSDPLVAVHPSRYAAEYHGPSGLGAIEVSADPDAGTNPIDAALGIIETIDQLRREHRPCPVLCLGPLTNLAKAILLFPELVQHVERATIMGGALGSPTGNVEPWAEFNIWSDSTAAYVVFNSGINIDLVPLDSTESVPVSGEDLERLAPSDPMLESLARSAIELHHRAGHRAAFLHDAVAAAALIRPDLFDFVPCHIVVHPGPPMEGRTEKEPAETSGSRIRVAVPHSKDDILSLILPASKLP